MAAFRVIVTGSREYTDRAAVWQVLDDLLAEHEPMVLVHGACLFGADLHAEDWYWSRLMRGRRVEIDRRPAKWRSHGKAAGPIRNAAMVAVGADLVVAFVAPPPAANRGTLGCVGLAEAAGIEVRRYGWTPPEK